MTPTTTVYPLRFHHALFTAVACNMSNTVSPTPRYLSAAPRKVGSEIEVVSGLGTERVISRRDEWMGRRFECSLETA